MMIYQQEKMTLKYRDQIVNGELTIYNENGMDPLKLIQTCCFKKVNKLKLVGFDYLQLERTLPQNIHELEIIGGQLFINDIMVLQKLSYSGNGRVTFMNEFPNIQHIYITGAQLVIYNQKIIYNIKDIQFRMMQTQQITFLSLISAQIFNADFLSKYNQLEHLNLSNNTISDVSFLKNLAKLQHLNISNNKIFSINVLKTFAKLVHFDASHNKIQDVKALGNNSDLEYLDISNNPVKYICLNKLTKLQHVNMINTEIYELSTIFEQRELTTFQVSSHRITSKEHVSFISIIFNNYNLINLGISGYNLQCIQSLNSFYNLQGLKQLDISRSQLSDISILSNFITLETLNISKNIIPNISVIQNFPHLTQLIGGFNQIRDISVILQCPKLQYIDLSHNLIVDIPQVNHKIKHLDISFNQIYKLPSIIFNNFDQILLQNNYISHLQNEIDLPQIGYQNIPDQKYIDLNSLDLNLQQLLHDCIINSKLISFNTKNQEYITKFDKYIQQSNFTDLDNLYGFSNWNYYKQMNQFNKLEIVSDDYIQGVNLCESQNIDAIILKRCMNVRFNRVNYNITALVVKSCNLQCIYGIEQMQQLKLLNLSDNCLTDISSLQGLHNLEYLSLEDNQVADISPISELNKLVVLIMTYKKVNPTDERASLNFELMPTNLNVLVVKWYYLRSLQGIHKLYKLQYLNLSFNQLRDIKQLQYLVSLNNLNISNNDLVFIKPLCNLRQLLHLDVSDNSIPNCQITQIKNQLKVWINSDSQNTDSKYNKQYLVNIKCVELTYQNLIRTKISRTCKKYKYQDQKVKVQLQLIDYCNKVNFMYSFIDNVLKATYMDTTQ
ncbi:Conserved_hypothetical protein [Hexamita inflata]|uniref:Uncharacterized protein n=1 Tax=Hexamita inflata TaxID=28002 RepID=A0AA86QU72_9EUKA|nr:Conserved hypothetical protein [Hexamita inflata]